MTSPTLFKEYIWLVNTIAKVRRITFADINDRWCETEMSGGIEIARATFNRHRRAIADIFGIYIDCDRRSNKYFIANEHECVSSPQRYDILFMQQTKTGEKSGRT